MNIFQSPPTKFQNHSRQIAIKDYRLKKTFLYLFPSLPHPLSNVGHEYFLVSADEFQNHSRQDRPTTNTIFLLLDPHVVYVCHVK